MASDDKEVVFTTYSDDCVFIVGRHNIDESALWGRWWPLQVDGKQVGEVMVDYGDGWEFHLRPLKGHTIEVDDDPQLLPDDEDEPWWVDGDE